MFSLDDFGVKKNIGVLNNGSKIFHFYKANMPLSTAVIFDAGSSNDPLGKEGLAHFVEHMLFKSTKKFKDETESGLFLESIGGQANAFTGVDLMGITADIGPSSDFSKVVDFIHELSRHSLFEESKVDVERGTIIGEISDYEANPAMYIHDLTQQLLFEGTYAARSIGGAKDTVERISREDLFNFYKSKISTSEMNIVVAGDVGFEVIKDTFNGLFLDGNLPEINSNKVDLSVAAHDPKKVKIYKDTDQVYMGFSFLSCPYLNKDIDALEVVRMIIGGGFSSSLFRKLRTESGLVYSIDVSSDNSFDRGYFSVVTSTSKDRVQKVTDVLVEEFKRLNAGDISEDELVLAKNKMIKSKIRQMQTSGSWVSFHLNDIVFNPDDPRDLSDWLNRVENIKLNEIINVSEKYFNPGMWNLSLCGDIGINEVTVDY